MNYLQDMLVNVIKKDENIKSERWKYENEMKILCQYTCLVIIKTRKLSV